MSRKALLLGATGLIGARVLERLLDSDVWQQVTVLSRRALDSVPSIGADKLRVVQTDLDTMQAQAAEFAVQDVFCCLGSTMKQAGSREAFYRVDHDYCVQAAYLARQGGAQRFLMVSAVNADAKGVSFYARTKGEAERHVIEAGVPLTVFMQPSLLRGRRAEFRLGEEAGLLVTGLALPLVRWTRASWLPVESDSVADAMVAAALHGPASGVLRLRYAEIQDYAQKLR